LPSGVLLEAVVGNLGGSVSELLSNAGTGEHGELWALQSIVGPKLFRRRPRTCILPASSAHHRRSFDKLLLRQDPTGSLEVGEVNAFVSTCEVGEVGE